MGFVGTLEFALELQVVGRIGEDEIDGGGLQFGHLGDAVADHDARTDLVRTDLGLKICAGRLCRRPATRHNHDSRTLTQATLPATRDQQTD
jgi:hypothetical protein